MSHSDSAVRAPPSPPDSVPSSPVEKGVLPEISPTSMATTPALHGSPIRTHLPPSPSPKSQSSSPNVTSNTAYTSTRCDHYAGESPFDLGSSSSSGDIAEAEGLMQSLGFSSPQSTASSNGPKELSHDLEEGEVTESLHTLMPTTISVGSLPSPIDNSTTPTPTHTTSVTPAAQSPRSQRERQSSQLGGAIPSSPEVVPSGPVHGVKEAPAAGNLTRLVEPSASLSTLPSTTTFSSLSTLNSASSFYTASSSSTSISSSGSTKDLTKSITIDDAASISPQPSLSVHGIPESGTINLEELTKVPVINSTLNPHAAEHIPTSSSTPALSSSSDKVDGITSSASAPAVSDPNDDDYKTPNVYINGLPPHFPEDQLFDLAAPFGEVKSVRSFTRHVGEKKSGYGFVLFVTVEAAEKCIQSLRRFRNLHPTFSKQVHKIPGLPYTQTGPTWEQDSTVTNTGSGHRAAGASVGSGQTFKSKMEKFSDPNSTNVYMEGLPLSIDEAVSVVFFFFLLFVPLGSLAALVSPHRIKSQRFFQTRLSNPPRIIAFVRLETRSGAEEIIERLHGRMVRGWNDPGSRISVRFADTGEQRELRRTERAIREDDNSPARLTIAQAALLNLRGREQLRSQSGYTAPVIGTTRAESPGAPTANQIYHDFTSNAHDHIVGGYRGSAHDISSAAVALVNAKNVAASMMSNPRSSYNKGQYVQGFGGLNPERRSLNPQMAALLDSLRDNGQPWSASGERYGVNGDSVQSSTRNPHPLGDVDINLGYPSHISTQRPGGGGVAQARSGYTPTEEFILQTHQMGQRRRGGGDQVDINVGVRGYRTQASTLSLPQSQSGSYYSNGSSLPAVLEDDFHSGQAIAPQGASSGQQYAGANRGAGQVQASRVTRGDGESSVQQYTSTPSTQTQVSNRNYNNSSNHNNQAHIRSTTLPPSTTPSANQSRHYQHNSMSVPKSRNVSSDILRTTSQQQQTQTSQSLSSKHRPTPIMNDNDNKPSLGNTTYTTGHRHGYDKSLHLNTDPDYKKPGAGGFNTAHTVYSSSANSFRGDDVYDVPQASPPLVSPALTYTSRGSAATLSPSTPYVGSFPSNGGGFQGQTSEEGVVGDGR
ncbi:hypothetical protein D9758_010351 [Tetrapyrgos nigripes]|uniref:RRM domain-containing protein n=1 Tax=Tetrapyrgos nigripes TaxID=182062 RepID=A0A8H5D085_9AGAR|nr:hypothetical protein D9758_010351 [Tetrapyrgos nigripes]